MVSLFYILIYIIIYTCGIRFNVKSFHYIRVKSAVLDYLVDLNEDGPTATI